MPHHVYANGNEIASKSSSGNSAGAAPDVCWSPPGPKVGPIPIPYSNTCKHADLDNLAGSVFVGGTGMALEDKSYFSTSYGNEPATSAYAKGIISGKIKGKCYFQSWSMNVKAEGLGVDRHMDLVTHNHVNQANTGPVVYKSRKFDSSVCKEDRNDIKKKCKPKKEEDRNKSRKAKSKRGKLATALGGFSEKADEASRAKRMASKNPYIPNKKNAWIDDYCDGLWASGVPENLEEEIKNYQKELKKLNKKVQNMDTEELVRYALDEALSMIPSDVVREELMEMALKAFAKAGIGVATAGTGIGLIVSAFLWAWTAYDIYQFQSKLTEWLGDAAGEYIDMMMDTDKVKEKLQAQVNALEKENTPNKLFGKMQQLKAKSNPCIKARKCKLTSYKNSSKINGSESCCPGQTGHHLLPDAMFRTPMNKAEKEALYNDWYDNEYNGSEARGKAQIPREKKPKKECWDGYSEDESPTICVEGGFSAGSHGMFHKQTAKKINKMRAGGKTEIKYTSVRDKLANLVNKKYGCDKKCLKAQLDEYYSKAYTCGDIKNAKVVAHTGKQYGDPKDNDQTKDDKGIDN